jgi:hypothetical protein
MLSTGIGVSTQHWIIGTVPDVDGRLSKVLIITLAKTISKQGFVMVSMSLSLSIKMVSNALGSVVYIRAEGLSRAAEAEGEAQEVCRPGAAPAAGSL